MTVAWLSKPSNFSIIQRMNAGCTIRPVAASVTSRQASKMLVLLWSLGLLFTAIITNKLSTTVKGQVMLLTMMFKVKLIQTGLVSCVPSPVEVLEKFEPEKLVMLR